MHKRIRFYLHRCTIANKNVLILTIMVHGISATLVGRFIPYFSLCIRSICFKATYILMTQQIPKVRSAIMSNRSIYSEYFIYWVLGDRFRKRRQTIVLRTPLMMGRKKNRY